MKQLTPRKGTRTRYDIQRHDVRFLETTHTPQGDGNCLVTALFTMSGETTYTPQGDGNSVILKT